jgi:site-specific recombinase XerD
MINISETVNSFLKNLKTEKKAKATFKNYRTTVNALVLFANDKNIVTEREFQNIVKNYIAYLSDNYSALTTIVAKRSALREYIRFLFYEHIIKEDFSIRIKSISVPQEEKKAFTIEEVIEVLDYLNNEIKEEEKNIEKSRSPFKLYRTYRDYMLFESLLEIGCRISDVVKIKWNDFDLRDEHVYVGSKKTKTGRINPIRTTYALSVSQYKENLRTLEEEFSINFLESKYIFYSREDIDKHITTRQVQRIIDKAVKGAGIERRTPHALRHTYGSLLTGKDLASAAELLGHSSKITAANIYSHSLGLNRRRNALNEAYSELDRAKKQKKRTYNEW